MQTAEMRDPEFFMTDNQRKKIELAKERIAELEEALKQVQATASEPLQPVEEPKEVTHVDLTKDEEQFKQLLSIIKKTGTEGDRIFGELEGALRDVGSVIKDDVSQGLTDIIMQAESAKNVFASLANQIARTIVQQQIADPLAEGLTDFATTAIPSLFTGGPGTQSIGGGAPPTVRGIGPPAANGGNVFSNKAHLVGERGPEMFVPGQDGRIIPNTEMGGAPNVNVNIINEGGEPLSVQSQSVRKSPNGETNIDLMVKSSIDRLDSQGQLDGMFRRHGGTRQGRF
jgi:hypothetical protein